MNRFGREAGIMLSFSTQATQGLQSPGVSGVHTADSGLASVLKGTGLVATRQRNGGYVVAAASAEQNDGAAALPMVQVTAQAQGATTENTGAYTGRATTIGKMEQSLRETPQSVSVITRQFMDDRNLTSLDEVMAQATGATRSQRNFGSHTFTVRGFAMNSYLKDGVPGSEYDDTSTMPTDMAIYDRVEILRGAAGLIVGAGDPSGVVNLVRKRPRKESHVDLNLSAASWDNYRTEVDAGTPLNQAGTLRGRVVAAYQDKHTFQDVTHAKEGLFYGVLEADLGPDTTLTFGGRRQENKIHGYTVFGLPRYSDGRALDVPRSTSLAQDWNLHDVNGSNLFAEIEHRFGGGWKARAAANYNKGAFSQQLGITRGMVDPVTLSGPLLYSLYFRDIEVESKGVDASISGNFQALGGTHEVMAGFNWSRQNQQTRDASVGSDIAVDIFNVNHQAVARPAHPAWEGDARSEDQRYGVYASARLELAKPLHLLVGGRVSWMDYRQVDALSGARLADNQQNHEFTPYTGLIYDLNQQWSLYASYADTFQVQSGYQSAGGAALKPAVGANYEAGIKGELYDGRLNLSAAVFQIRKDNLAVLDEQNLGACPNSLMSTDCYRNGSTLRSKGVELEASGEIAPGWQLMAGYTFVTSRDDAGVSISSETPHHLFKASTSYRLPGAWQALTVGAGVQAQSHYAFPAPDDDSVTMGEGGRAVWDLNGSYRINSKWSAQLNVNNLFDKHYYSMLGSLRRGNYFGEPRSISLMLRATL
ncbi:TonB-dependent siderophore receptor [Duganella sp. P38]|uniref:TonB-dependent siderophore receptor n=1 Tax=Duganella sp. P38 TaxID=3423949 RepID=UPI003D7B2628